MKAYMLIYSIGLQHGYEELVGVFTNEEALNAAKNSHKRKSSLDGEYTVDDIELDTIINYDLCSW